MHRFSRRRRHLRAARGYWLQRFGACGFAPVQVAELRRRSALRCRRLSSGAAMRSGAGGALEETPL